MPGKKKSWEGDLGDSTVKDVDEETVFSVDPEMFEKTGVKKPRNMKDIPTMEADKLYRFQLQKDAEKIARKYGRFRARNAQYLRYRENDPVYNKVAEPTQLGKLANFEAVSQAAQEAR